MTSYFVMDKMYKRKILLMRKECIKI